MSRPTLVRIGGLSFHGTVPRGAPFEGFALRELDGWNDGAPVRVESAERPGQHGDFDLPVTRGPRLVTMSGWCRAYSPEKLRHFSNQLTGLLADGQTGRLVVDEWGEAQWADVRLFGDPRFRRRGGSGYADWSLKLRAPDPQKFGDVREFPAGQPAVHFGNFPSAPVLEVTGPTPAGGYTVTGPAGKTFVVTQGLAAGQKHRIDMATGRVYRDGALQLGVVSNGGTWVIPPGLPGVTHTVSAGSLKVLVTDTFV